MTSHKLAEKAPVMDSAGSEVDTIDAQRDL